MLCFGLIRCNVQTSSLALGSMIGFPHIVHLVHLAIISLDLGLTDEPEDFPRCDLFVWMTSMFSPGVCEIQNTSMAGFWKKITYLDQWTEKKLWGSRLPTDAFFVRRMKNQGIICLCMSFFQSCLDRGCKSLGSKTEIG